MEQPPIGQEVVVSLADGGEWLAIWNGIEWLVGVNDDPNDEPLNATVVDWRWRTE